MVDTIRAIAKPQRWDLPFWSERSGSDLFRDIPPMTEAEVDKVLSFSPFRHMDPKKFSASAPLRGVLLNDTRLRLCQKGELIVRQGDYGNSAFFILHGSVRVILENLGPSQDTLEAPRKTFFGVLGQFIRRPKLPEVRDYEKRPVSAQGSATPDQAVFLQDVSAVYRESRSVILKAGEFFGEIAALTRSPRTSSILAEEDCELLEIRWQGLRELRLRAPEVKAHIDRIYRDRSLQLHLLETSMFKEVAPENIEKIAAETDFQSHGNFEWYSTYREASQRSASERLEIEPVIAREGHYPNGIFLIRSGFARISEKHNHGERTISYLGRGQAFGFDEIFESWTKKEPIPFRRTLRAVGYTDVLFVPTAVLERYVFPILEPEPTESSPAPRHPVSKSVIEDLGAKLGPSMLEFLVERRYINGTAAMIIDMNRCTRCDDCVRACAATHQNNPRFIRHGPIHDRFMIANACMHCQDPVCMIGCPTGAIHRETARGEVVINDLTCIGCATCANSCPYDNIQMVSPRDRNGNLYYESSTQLPIQKAAKCDFCNEQLPGVGPACANACPHDAMIRVDMRDFERLSKWFNR